jgi:septal ring factor EnvC (AmiA/AmiB activator)
MAKKKVSKVQQSLDRLAALITDVSNNLENFKSETRYALATSREVVTAQTDRVSKLTSRLDQIVGQVNGGFQNTKSDLQRVAQALNAHERDIAAAQTRLLELVSAQQSKKRKR